MIKSIPKSWQCDPSKCEYLGHDIEGNEYWQVQADIMKHKDGYTRWLCSLPAWQTYKQIVNIIP